MDENKKPRSRVKKVVNEGQGIGEKGEALGTGPVNNTGSYADRREQQARPVQGSPFSQQRPSQSSPFGQKRLTQGQSSPFGQQRPTQGQSSPFGQQRPSQGQGGMGFPFGMGGTSSGASRPASGTTNSAGTGTQKQYSSATRQNGTGTQRSSGQILSVSG